VRPELRGFYSPDLLAEGNDPDLEAFRPDDGENIGLAITDYALTPLRTRGLARVRQYAGLVMPQLGSCQSAGRSARGVVVASVAERYGRSFGRRE
jgi:hypothetical protein